MNGMLDPGEQCDDGNSYNNDGCTQCTLDPIQVDFNTSDPVGTRVSIEYFDLDEVVFFVADPNMLGLSFTPTNLV